MKLNRVCSTVVMSLVLLAGIYSFGQTVPTNAGIPNEFSAAQADGVSEILDLSGQALQLPVLTLTAAPSTSGLAPLTVTFTASCPVCLVYVWDFGDGEVAEGVTSTTHTYQEPGTYYAVVAAADKFGNPADAYEVITVTTIKAQCAPPNYCAYKSLKVTVSLTPTAVVNLSCVPPTSGTTPTGYNLYRSLVSSGPYTLLSSNTSCSFVDTTVAYSTTYYYVATSTNTTCPTGKTCESFYSNQATAVVPSNPVPNPPTGLTSTPVVSLNWEPPSEQVASYVVYRRLVSDPNYTDIATVTQPNYLDTSVSSGTYYYRIRAIVNQGNGQVFSGWSNLTEIVVD